MLNDILLVLLAVSRNQHSAANVPAVLEVRLGAVLVYSLVRQAVPEEFLSGPPVRISIKELKSSKIAKYYCCKTFSFNWVFSANIKALCFCKASFSSSICALSSSMAASLSR